LVEIITASSNDNHFRTTSDDRRRTEAATPWAWAAQEAPPSRVAFGIGGILFIISTFMWLQRVKILKDRTSKRLLWSELLRGVIACRSTTIRRITPSRVMPRCRSSFWGVYKPITKRPLLP